MILTIRTDKPEAEIGLFFNTGQKRQYELWAAHRELAETIHKKISEQLQAENIDWKDITGVVCYSGPGSFTGLRIGLTVGNTLAYSLKCPIVSRGGYDWIRDGVEAIASGEDEKVTTPEYGRDPHITKQKK